MSSMKATPLRRSCSSGTVMNCSTSSADKPSASVCTSTRVGLNSGRESTGAPSNWVAPRTIRPTAAAITRPLNFTLESIIQRTRCLPALGQYLRVSDDTTRTCPSEVQ